METLEIVPQARMLELMLLTAGERERSETEYRSLLRSSGFELTRVIPTLAMFSILEVVKFHKD